MTHHESPAVLALLADAKERPYDDAPRLVLADWLDDHGHAERAEFVRAQLRLAPGGLPLEEEEQEALKQRCRELTDRHGGAWLGPLWRWALAGTWHRGLLSVRVPRRFEASPVEQMSAWIDTLLFRLSGRAGLERAGSLLSRCAINHLGVDFRHGVGERALLDGLARMPALPCLRSLAFDWPLRLLVRAEGGCTPAVGADFLRRLLALPLAEHLTHLASNWPFTPVQCETILSRRVTAEHARHSLWMHDLPPERFRRTGRSAGPDVRGQ